MVIICLAVIGTVIGIAGGTVGADVDRLKAEQGADMARALALAAAIARTPAGWDREDLTPVIVLVGKAGVAAQIHNDAGRLIRSSPGYAGFNSPVQQVPVIAEGQEVGSVTIKFEDKGLAEEISHYQTLRWHIVIAAAVAAALIAVAVSLIASRRLTAPAERLVTAARVMASGNSSVRVGNVRGVPEVRELSAAFDQMADSVSMEALQRRDMAADLAHELRAPIAVLQAGIEAIQDGLAEPTLENLGSLRDEVVRLAQMTDDLRFLASGHEADLRVELATHDLAAIASETADSLASSFEAANVSLDLQLAPVNVLADARRIHEVAVNLLGNAVKFTPAGGRVTLETGPAVNAQFAMLRVSDTGIGIPAEELPYVTQRFFRGKGAVQVSGSGIGLAIVDQLARLHHGRMLIVSEPGRGTQVTVMLPRERT
jgi:two-component system sensor histidine kinase BaeS